MSELTRLVKPRDLPGEALKVEAGAAECAALAERFGLSHIGLLRAKVGLEKDGDGVRASGRLDADITQMCAVSAEDFPVQITEEFAFRFVPESAAKALDHDAQGADIEIELSDEDCDEIIFSGDSFDVGEAIAQTLGLAIDPYAEGPNADAARRETGITREGEQDGPLAEALKGLKQS